MTDKQPETGAQTETPESLRDGPADSEKRRCTACQRLFYADTDSDRTQCHDCED